MLWWLIKVHWPYFILTQLLVNWLLEDITLQWSLGDSELVNDLPISTPDVMGIYRHWHPPNATLPQKSKALLRDSEGIMVVNKPNIKPANFPGRVAYWYRHRCSWVFHGHKKARVWPQKSSWINLKFCSICVWLKGPIVDMRFFTVLLFLQNVCPFFLWGLVVYLC